MTLTMISNPQLELAYKFVRDTNKNIFLTGKAGTGKTTFLQSIKREALKRMAIVAPTGVAAINAGGMTIHSFFQLPFGPMIPGQMTQEIRQRKFSREKIKLIRSLDLLVIDEISMVRADLLDAIDEVLRRYKDFSQPFGGVQLLMVGDLHQLPPVVKNEEWRLLGKHYDTMYFFGSHALRQTNPVSIELKHIYRQSDEQFIELLNKVRNNKMDKEVLELLNSRYRPDFKPDDNEGYITLTSHNASAQKINNEKLKTLKKKSYFYKAEIEGKFPEKSYPTEEKLEFKIGAQVMFVRNDHSQDKLYYNGKIGRITKISKAFIKVRCPGDSFDIEVGPVEWQNKKYTLNEKTKEIEEDLVGSFTQMPLKTAWAITIHKSQGLTFERAIIDAAAAFAHGQVYVALSRCKSFEGVVLRSPIGQSSVKTDYVVKQYSEEADRNAPNEKHLEQSKMAYQQSLIRELFDFKFSKQAGSQLNRVLLENEKAIQGNAFEQFDLLRKGLREKLYSIAEKFKPQLQYYFNQQLLLKENEELQTRIKKASNYFLEKLKTEFIPAARSISVLTDNQAVEKSAKEKIKNFQKTLFVKQVCFEASLDGFEMSEYLQARLNADLDFKVLKTKTPSVKKALVRMPHPILNKELVTWRKAKGEALDIPLYRILSTKSLIEILHTLPADKASLKAVKGIGAKKIKDYGVEILEMIAEYKKREE